MKIIAGSYIAKMWKEPLSISQEKCVMHCTVFVSDHLRKENEKDNYNETLLLIAIEIIVVVFDFTILRY